MWRKKRMDVKKYDAAILLFWAVHHFHQEGVLDGFYALLVQSRQPESSIGDKSSPFPQDHSYMSSSNYFGS